MHDTAFAFSELETAAAAIAAFTATQNARTESLLTGPAYDADVATLRQMFERPDRLRSVIRRGTWLFTIRQTAENPRGLWLRLPEHITPTHDAPWEAAFDVDAHCRDTGLALARCVHRMVRPHPRIDPAVLGRV